MRSYGLDVLVLSEYLAMGVIDAVGTRRSFSSQFFHQLKNLLGVVAIFIHFPKMSDPGRLSLI